MNTDIRVKLIRYICVLILAHVAFVHKAVAQQPVIYKNGGNVVLGEHVAILEDSTNRLTINEVLTNKNFAASGNEVPNLKLSKSSFWLRFSIKNQSAYNHLLLSLEYPTLSVCDFYHPENHTYKLTRFTDTSGFYKRKYKHQDFIFDINLPKDSAATYYIKVESSEQMILPLILSTEQQTAESLLAKNLFWGILIGLILVMILYNLFVYLSTKDVSYLYYVLYTTFIGLTQTTLSGYTFHYLFYNHPWLFKKAIVVFPGLAGVAAVLFVSKFLHTKQRTPKLHKFLGVVIILYSTAIVLRLLGYNHASYRMIDISALCVTGSIYAAALITSAQGYRPARFFLLAWTIFLGGLVLFVLRNLGVLPYNVYTNYTMQVGTAFEITLLSLALADKINIFKAEKEKSQEETLLAVKENERIVREQNVVLEARVSERTLELRQSNQELNQTLEELKQAQTQLVEAEKMASLGQLTAGIAHEINNPINFVTSNINPLRRDIEMVLDTLKTVEEIGISELPIAEKQKQIQDYKDELDFDYLTLEINHLMKGITEGANRTAEIVKGLRIFSRLDEDDLKRADVNEGLDSTLVIANNLIGKIRVEKQYGDLPFIECYAGKLNQVFLNIISNAVYAVKKRFGDSADGKLEIITTHDQQNVYIKIKDNGTGMSVETQRKMFDPFFTTKDVGEGTGLGMSIAYNTIKKHQGQIRVESVLNEGTEFTLVIPINFDPRQT
ncbi:7TM diverse intracellular signaling domain-containing protein [Mucilaginibacter sp. PAMB04168]|uniref:sensor histidine kinase n=1 Tax=Mucilaginibacter sp. PAMB04168 TaxID=3138567 RepID=UPI0031F6D5A0